MRTGSAARKDPHARQDEDWISSAPGPAPGRRSRTAQLPGDAQVATEPERPPEDQGPIAGQRPMAREAGSGSFMPPMVELVAASEETPARRREVNEVDDEESAEALDTGEESAEPAGDELDADPDDVPAIAHGELLSSGFERAADSTGERLDPSAIEASLASELEGIEEPRDSEGERARLTRVAQVAGTRRRAALDAIDGENAEVDLEEESIARRAADRSRDDAVVLEGRRKAKVAGTHSKMASKKARRVASRDELKTRLRAAQAADTMKAAEALSRNMFELETRLAGQLAGLVEEQKIQEEAIALDLTTQNASLSARIEEKRVAHAAQIEREKIALDLTATSEAAATRAEAVKQAADIVAGADAQAAYTLTESQIHADNTEGKASKEAQQARDAGEAKAQQAIAAADDRAAAAAADESEKASIAAEGESRANQARAQAESRAGEIEGKGTADAASIRDKGKADSAAQKAQGRAESIDAIGRGEGGVKRIEDELAAGIALMQVQSTIALAEMENERALAMLELEQARNLALTQMALDMALAAVKISTERTAGVAALRTEHDDLVAAIDLAVEADLAKVDVAGDKELAGLERSIDDDLAAIEREAQAAGRRMKTAVDAAESRALKDTAARRKHIRDAGVAVIDSIDRVVAKAERAIDKADQDTSQEIGDAARVGVTSIALEGQEARDDNQQASETAIQEQEAAARTARSETTQLATDAAAQMEADRQALDGEIDQQWVDDAMARSGELLSRDGTDWAVTDEESVEAMHVMASLPPHLQGQVIDGLDDDQFDELLSEMDEDRHEHLDPLVDAASDPRRKLELFAACHTSMVKQDAIRAQDTWMGVIAKETGEEMKDELEFLRARDPLTDQDVNELIARKELEHQIEEDFRINFTNERNEDWDPASDDVDANGDKIVWRESDLLEVQAILGQMPDEHVRGNTMLEEMRREDLAPGDVGEPVPEVGADHGDGVITVYDAGNDPNVAYRHTGDTPESLDPSAGRNNGTIGQLEEVLIHEVGHDIHDQHPEAFAAFQAAGGWETHLEEDDLSAAGLNEDAIEDIEDNEHPYPVNGRVYQAGYGEFNSYDDGRIPLSGQGKDTWPYARSDYHEHFAETYAKAVLVPEQLAKDLLDDPADHVADRTLQRDLAAATRDTAKAQVAALQATSPPPPLADLAAAYEYWMKSEVEAAREQNTLDEATADQEGMKEQYRIMREDVFHTGEEVEAARARLEAKGISPARLQDFLDKASRFSTPEQVKRLEAKYP